MTAVLCAGGIVLALLVGWGLVEAAVFVGARLP